MEEGEEVSYFDLMYFFIAMKDYFSFEEQHVMAEKKNQVEKRLLRHIKKKVCEKSL